MSTTFSIGCKQCQKKLWIAQTSCGGPLHVYTTDEANYKLAAFLEQHQGHPLLFDHDQHPDIESMEDQDP